MSGTGKFFVLFAALAVFSCSGGQVHDVQHLERSSEYGSLDTCVFKYLQEIRSLGSTNELKSVMVLKDGKVLEEWYDVCYGPDFLNICWSASKTFTSTAIGFAVQDGLVKIDDKLVDFLDDDMIPETVSDTLASLTVYDLLRMSSGFKLDPIGATSSLLLKNPVKTVLEGGFKFWPGERFAYNSLNTYMLSVIVTKVTGKLVQDYLDEKLFSKMGIRNYHWDVSAEHFNMGGWGLYMTTEGLAKMGLFLLQKGVWNGEQLLDPGWVEQATTAQIYQKGEPKGDDWNNGYGYQTWICRNGGARIDGAHGQVVILCPEKNAVIAVTQYTSNTRFMDSIWECFYNAI